MKVLFVLLVVALLLAAGVWKTQNPDAGFAQLREQAEATAARFGRGVQAVVETPGAADAGDASEIAAVPAESALITGLTERIDTLEAHIDALAAELAERDAAASDEQPENFEKADSGSGAADAKALENSVAGVREQLAAIENRLASSEEAQQSLRGRLDQQDTLVDELRTRAAEQQTRLSALSQGAESSGSGNSPTDITALQQRVASVESSIESLKAARDKPGGAGTTGSSGSATKADASVEVGKLQQEISSQLDTLQQRIDNTDSKPDVDALTAALETTRARIEDLEQQMLAVPETTASENDTDALRESLQQQMQELESRLKTSASEPDAELVRAIDEVKGQIDQLTSQSYVTMEEFEARRTGRTNEYKVFFTFNSTEITEEAAAELDEFIAQEQDKAAAVSIFGLTDRIGPADYNQLLAERRARRVRSYLIQNGFDYTRIQAATGLGEDAAASILEDEQEDAQQRAVVLFAEQP